MKLTVYAAFIGSVVSSNTKFIIESVSKNNHLTQLIEEDETILDKFSKKAGYCTEDYIKRIDSSLSTSSETESTVEECLEKCHADAKCKSVGWIDDTNNSKKYCRLWFQDGFVGLETPTIDIDITANCYAKKSVFTKK